jgi:hypothetical protein
VAARGFGLANFARRLDTAVETFEALDDAMGWAEGLLG